MIFCLVTISLAVIGYQIFFAVGQVTMYAIGGRVALVISYLGVLFLTFRWTENGLFIFQVVVQTLVFLFLFKVLGKREMDISNNT